jgi:nucleoside-diphosphate-sugar epimerase
VDDNIRALQLMMSKDEATGEIINIGNPTEYQIIDVAHRVRSLTDSESRITFHPLPQHDPKVRRPVIEKARKLLGWEPVTSLEEGLIRTIEAYRKQYILQMEY